MTKKEYRALFEEDEAVGWKAIEAKVKEIYPEQEARHYAPPLPYSLGGRDPLDGSSIYDSHKQEFHRHIIGYGMSELYYNEDVAGNEFSKWGFEFTFRLKPFDKDEGDPLWAIEVMNNLARYVYESGKWFEEFQFGFGSGNQPIRTQCDIDIVGVAFVPDTELGTITTPHGNLTFLQMVGITSAELAHLKANPTSTHVKTLIDELKKDNPLLITDLMRRS